MIHCTVDAAGRLSIVLDAWLSQRVLMACPRDVVSFTCIHGNTAGILTRWTIQHNDYKCTRLVDHVYMTGDQCGPLTFTMISDNTGSTVTSTALMTATEELDGALVSCKAGSLLMSPQVGNATIHIIGEILVVS